MSILQEALALSAKAGCGLAERIGSRPSREGGPTGPASARGAAIRASPGMGTMPTEPRSGPAAGAGAPLPKGWAAHGAGELVHVRFVSVPVSSQA